MARLKRRPRHLLGLNSPQHCLSSRHVGRADEDDAFSISWPIFSSLYGVYKRQTYGAPLIFHIWRLERLFDRRYPSHCTIHLPTGRDSHTHVLTLSSSSNIFLDREQCSPIALLVIYFSLVVWRWHILDVEQGRTAGGFSGNMDICIVLVVSYFHSKYTMMSFGTRPNVIDRRRTVFM